MERFCVTVSPETYRLIETDETYRQQVTKQVLEEQQKLYDEVIFIPLDDEGSNEQENLAPIEQKNQMAPSGQTQNENEQSLVAADCSSPPSSEEKQYWGDAATKLMLSIMEELRPKLGKSIAIKNKIKMYKAASEEMAKKGYAFSPAQIENKFRGLERQYKKVALNNKQTGRSRQTCSFENELSKILGEKRALVPEFVLENGEVEGVARLTEPDETCEAENVQKDDGPSCSSSAAKKRRLTSMKEQIIEKLDEMKEEKKEFYSAILKLLKKKDEREEIREKRAQKKMELLERLIEKQTKP